MMEEEFEAKKSTEGATQPRSRGGRGNLSRDRPDHLVHDATSSTARSRFSLSSSTPHKSLPLELSIAMPRSLSFVPRYLRLAPELLLDRLQPRYLNCSTKRVTLLLRRSQIPFSYTRFRSFSRSYEHMQTKHFAFPTVFWSEFPYGNLESELNPKYSLVLACGHSYSSKLLGPRLLSDDCVAEW